MSTPNKNRIVPSGDWVYLCSRPHNLFSASLYQAWFDPGKINNLLGESIPDNLYVEEHKNVIRKYVKKNQLKNFENQIKNIVKNDKEKTEYILKRGLELSEQAKKYIKNTPFSDIESAISFMVDMTAAASVFSYFSYPNLDKTKDKDLFLMAEKLRSISMYPDFVKHIVKPLAQKIVGDSYEFLTITEIVQNKILEALPRKKHSICNRFVYTKVGNKELVTYTDDVVDIIAKLESTKVTQSTKGQTAYPGKTRGRVRLVLSSHTNIEFNQGDILFVTTSNPTLMPLIRKSGAIVSDEGGIMCHAAIVSRELKIPCIIGTKFGTHNFKDGDIVEVDADKGMVKLAE